LCPELVKESNEGGLLDGKKALYLAYISTIFNLLFTFFTIYNKSKAFDENFLQYMLNCLIAKHNWIPFISYFKDNEIKRNLEFDSL